MYRRFLAIPILLSLIAAAARAQADAHSESVPRDWAQYPAIVSIAAPKTLYALGDVHGDYDRVVQLLAATRLIDAIPASPASAHWAGGRAVLVCTGDLIDKYDHAIAVIELLTVLQQQAAAKGGVVIVTLGNHEAEFLAAQGGDRKATEFADELKKAGVSPADVALGRDAQGIGAWLRNLPAGAKIGDWFFCHAGNTGGKTLAELGNDIQEQVTAQGWGAPILADPSSMLEARMHPRPWWDSEEPKLKDAETAARGKEAAKGQQKAGEMPTDEQRLRKTIEALGAGHLVFGHQPGKVKFRDGTERLEGQMFSKYDGLVFMIDTGMSRGVQSGRGALLKIEPISKHPSATAIYADGTTAKLWP